MKVTPTAAVGSAQPGAPGIRPAPPSRTARRLGSASRSKTTPTSARSPRDHCRSPTAGLRCGQTVGATGFSTTATVRNSIIAVPCSRSLRPPRSWPWYVGSPARATAPSTLPLADYGTYTEIFGNDGSTRVWPYEHPTYYLRSIRANTNSHAAFQLYDFRAGGGFQFSCPNAFQMGIIWGQNPTTLHPTNSLEATYHLRTGNGFYLVFPLPPLAKPRLCTRHVPSICRKLPV